MLKGGVNRLPPEYRNNLVSVLDFELAFSPPHLIINILMLNNFILPIDHPIMEGECYLSIEQLTDLLIGDHPIEQSLQ
jgi:hypothetical protein